MHELESHLRSLCTEDARLRLLEAQWEYDKNLVQQALQTVGNTFPHYSRHDATHSNTILINIARILGPRVAHLSATDTWLLLEAAYWHDAGMVLSDAALRDYWSSPAFSSHLADLQDGDDPLLARAARLLSDRAQVKDLGAAWPVDVRQALTFVAADFTRQRHAQRSAEAVRRPGGFGIASPRTLIPERLFGWLAQVCLAHGQTRQQVEALPLEENGIARDLCHPRFVAFLLRLGDLLDLDNGRFCPVLLATIGRVPPASLDHIGKHSSITRFYVAPDRIDVEGVCTPEHAETADADQRTYGAHAALSQWLDSLKDELTFVAVRWGGLAPATLGGGPPSIGSISATLRGYALVPGSTTSAFGVDPHYILKLSKTSSIFGAPQQAWLRELITNAVDATLIRLWHHVLTDDEQRSLLESADPIDTIRRLSSTRFSIGVGVVPDATTRGTPENATVECDHLGSWDGNRPRRDSCPSGRRKLPPQHRSTATNPRDAASVAANWLVWLGLPERFSRDGGGSH
jgi:hypothetical protein